jgi:hypothetical protein
VQSRPGVPLDHIEWIGQAIVKYKPDTVVCLGDFWDLPSLNSHEEPGSAPMEGKRYADDIAVGNDAFARMSAPMDAEIARLRKNKDKRWNPRKVFLMGNHEIRADRAASNDPKWAGHVGSEDCKTPGWERHGFLEVVEIDSILYSHYFKMHNSMNAIGGSADSRLNRIGRTHVQGHQVGFQYGNRPYPDGSTRHSLVAGSCYLHDETYRGPQSNRHFRGVVVLNEVENGEFLIMPISLKYLCMKFTGQSLYRYMTLKYPHGSWDNLR